MATQQQYNTTVQPYRNIDIKLEVLDYNYYIVDEISGLVESANFSINADSDIRRTCNISMQLKDEFSEDPLYIDKYWLAGNPFWFDKYLRINLGIQDIISGDTIWCNQGIYLINEPSVTYDAENNSLSFQAVDLMAKFTGLRNGNLEGLEYVVNAGTSIKEVMQNIVKEYEFQQYIILDPPQATTPYEIRISAGGTAYDLLSELRDINPNWEMFFDVDGTFYFQEILNEETIKEEKITPFVDNETIQDLLFGYNLDTSFENVKNYIEVYGSYLEANKSATVTYRDVGNISIDISDLNTMTNGEQWIVGFTLGSESLYPSSGAFEELSTPVNSIKVYSNNVLIDTINITNLPLKYNNWDYRIKVSMYDNVKTFEYLGYAQPFGIAWEDNENSPFYVGELLNNSTITETPTDAIATSDNPLPKFKQQIRLVLSGGEYDNIYSNELAVERAKYELYLRARKHDNISINLLPIYWLDVNQLMEYKLPNEEQMSYWLIKDISTTFGIDGTQTINAIRQYI